MAVLMEIKNTTKRPLRVPLPGGKRLHLGPAASGQVTPKAAEHPGFKQLLDSGEIEIVDEHNAKGASQSSGNTGFKPGASGGSSSSGGTLRHTGDR